MNEHKTVIRRAEQFLPTLREGVALLPGCRDRQSRPLLFIPSKEQQVNGEQIKNVLHYLYEVTAEDARGGGITVVIDMRGKQPSSNVKSYLKAIDDLGKDYGSIISTVLVIKPEKLFSTLGMSKGSIKAEVQWIAADQLTKYVDRTQLLQEFGGTYNYHHEEWLRTRIELERWIWKISNILRGLEELREAMVETDLRLADVPAAKDLIDRHNNNRERLLNLCPVETLHSEHNNIFLMINSPQNGVNNPDLKAALPFTKNLIDTCVARKEEIYIIWKARYDELENVYQFKLFEQDADEKLRWIRNRSSFLQQSMGEIGNNEVEANERLRQFDDVEKSVKNSDVTVDQLQTRSARLKAVGTPHRSKVDATERQLREEWDRLKAMLIKRRTIVTSAAAFFRCAGQYFSRYRTWSAQPGIDPATVDPRNDAQLDEAISQHQEYWNTVEAVYLDAVNTGSQLKQHLKVGEAVEAQAMVVARMQELSKSHKILYDKWRESKVRLHSMLALTAFQTDTQRVFEWLNQHGDPYLKKNTRIGENEEQAKQLQRNHEQFRRIAENTYVNATKLFDASNMITESGVANSDRMARLLGDLQSRLFNFRTKSDIRKKILDHSLLFHIHFNELTAWFKTMETKYGQWIASEDLNECEGAKEMWVQENDATAGAFATTVGEGNDLINQLRANQTVFDVDYMGAIGRVVELLTKLEEDNARFINKWSIQRQILDISCSYAGFVRDVTEVRAQISSWEEDMRGMVNSPSFIENAVRVKPFHEDNYLKVKDAVSQIKNFSKELLQAVHGNQLTAMKTRDGRNLVDVVQENTRILDRAERQVTQLAQQTSEKIDYALKYSQLRHIATQIIDHYEHLEHAMYEMGGVPDKLLDSQKALDRHNQFRNELEKNNLNSELARRFFQLSNELLGSNHVPREYLTQLNENVTSRWRRLCALTEERQKLFQTALMYYKTTENIIPILEQLEKICKTSPVHTCQHGAESDLPGRLDYATKELSKHEAWKEKFVKSFIYAQKTSDSFIKYIGRSHNGKNAREINQRNEDVHNRKSALRERQTKLFEMWQEKKRTLQSCQEFVLLKMSRKDNLDWMDGEGQAQLARFQEHSKNLTPANKDSVLEDFSRFKIAVKERRTTIQTLLGLYADFLNNAGEHQKEMEKGMAQIRDRAEKFFKVVADCEVALRGGKLPANKDELSLDRNSDHSVGERLEAMGSVVSKEMKKMREPVEELIKTEREYVKGLQQCVDTYIREFDRAAATLPLQLRGRRKEIFSNLEDICQFHQKIFLPELLKYETDPEGVGCSFTFHVDCLNELYTEYCTNKDTRDHKELMDSPDFIQYFGDIRDKNAIDNLPSMLIKPVQRITRYGLMIQQLLKMTEAVVRAEGNENGSSSSHRNVEEIRDAYEVVLSVPKRANDIMHYTNLEKDKLDLASLGPFVMQDALTVWEPKAFLNKKGKERQVFLFEMAVVVAKRLDMPSRTVRYVTKGKPLPLSAITVVEHVESDVCRFGLRVGNESSNENRIDFKAKDEKEKIAWVRRIRELRGGLSMGGAGNWDPGSRSSLGSSSTSAPTVRSSKISTSSGEGGRFSQDGESLSLEGGVPGSLGGTQRNSVQSYGSAEGASDQWLIRSDFDAAVDGQLTVKSGEKVETLDQQPTDKPEWMHVVVVDEPHRTGLVPVNILLHDQPSSSTDRPDTNNGGSVVKRKSLRRIFANSNKEQKNNTNNSSAAAAGSSSSAPAPQPTSTSQSAADNSHVTTTATTTVHTPSYQTNHQTPQLPAEVPVIVSSAPEITPADDEPLEGLPPPMEELSLNSSAAHMNEETKEGGSAREEEADAPPKADEKSPEEVARFKRHYVLMELVETEKDYVRDLTSVVEGYIANLEQMDLPPELQGKDKIIFANIAQILDFHKKNFLNEIEKCLENYEAAGSAFVKYQRRLDVLYVKYCQNKPKSDYLVSQDDFEAFFAETKAKLGHKVALCDLLIKPVQRIMKYQLLLKDILKFTERAKDPTLTLKKALEVMHVVPKACDDMMQVGRLQNFDGNLSAQGRLIHQGTLVIQEQSGSNSQKPKDRRIFLFEQSAIIADHIPPKKEFGNPIYIFKNQIMVNKMQFQKGVSADEPLKFLIGSTDPSQPNFIAIAQTQEEKDEWVQKLEDMLDQQKRMLEQLVNPKKFMGGDDIAGGLGAMTLQGGSKALPAKAVPAAKPTTPKPESPKKSKLFGFGKSKPSSKTPASPPETLPAVASCPFFPVRKGDIFLHEDEEVSIEGVRGRRATVSKIDGTKGTVPVSFLEPGDLRGNSLVEQIEYRRQWLSAVDGTSNDSKRAMSSSPLSNGKLSVVSKPVWSDGRPEFIRGISDLRVRQGERVELAPLVLSTVPYSLIWRGPALEAGRAEIEKDGIHSRLIIPSAVTRDMGPYSVVAENEFGITSQVALVTVASRPEPPVNLRVRRTGAFSVRLDWERSSSPVVRYAIECRREDLPSFWCPACSLKDNKAHIRGFYPAFYFFRVYAYNSDFRSPPTNEVTMNLAIPHLESSEESPDDRTPFSRSESV